MRALDRKLARELWRLRGQVVSIALVVACGVMSVVTTRSALNSLSASRERYYADYRFAHVFASAKRAPEALRGRIEAIPGVAAVQTRVVLDVTLDVPGLDEAATGRLVSIPERRTPTLNDLHLRRGRWVAPGRRDEVLVSERFAEANGLREGDALGAVINGRWERLRIVGVALSPEYVYEMAPGQIFPDNRRFGVLWMSREALGPAYDMEGAFNDVALTLAPGASEKEVIAALDRLLERYGGFGAYGRDDQVSDRVLRDELAQNRVSATLMPAIFLGVAAFLLHIVLLRLVGTQRDAIAVLKAFGYSSLDVGRHYLRFALAAVLLGAALGTAVGVWLGRAYTTLYAEFFRFPVLEYRVSWTLVALGVGISGGAAVVGALSAVRGAVRLPPAEAMRPEAPARFRPGVLERIGLGALFSAAGRMIVRNFERFPARSGISALGVAMAVAILVVGSFMFDAINYMMALQFRYAQREDLTVTFVQPRNASVRHDLAHVPGVVAVEPFRLVPVRLREGPAAEQTAITALEPGGRLRRVVDMHYRTWEVPPEGLLITSTMAEKLGVRAGDSVTVEVLEGRRPTLRLPVAGAIEELFGLNVYMDARALARVLGETRTVSGAYLRVDPARYAEVHRRLKAIPAVGGVQSREAMLKGFEENMARSLSITTTLMVTFATIIAVGVVYNGARIALSERGRELASLRVLGFTRREVSVLLLGEQATVTAIGIPAGFAIGYGLCVAVVRAFEVEVFRIPLIVSGATYAFAAGVIVVAALLAGLIVRRRIDHLDLVAVLKTRE
ncbi:MAG TPA: FtsX-like permease family protein [Longimicrobium sp.]|nr:FtsX-like permease family protein [Longimicrobium sp.]